MSNEQDQAQKEASQPVSSPRIPSEAKGKGKMVIQPEPIVHPIRDEEEEDTDEQPIDQLLRSDALNQEGSDEDADFVANNEDSLQVDEEQDTDTDDDTESSDAESDEWEEDPNEMLEELFGEDEDPEYLAIVEMRRKELEQERATGTSSSFAGTTEESDVPRRSAGGSGGTLKRDPSSRPGSSRVAAVSGSSSSSSGGGGASTKKRARHD